MTGPFWAAGPLPSDHGQLHPNTMNSPDLDLQASHNADDLADDSGQRDLAQALFTAILYGKSQEVLRVAHQIRSLDSHRDSTYGETPLILASRCDLKLDAFEALLARSNPLLANEDGETALMLVAWGTEAHSFASVQLLLPLSDPLAARFDGATALHFAIYARQPETVALLLPLSDLQQRNASGRLPLEEALASISAPGDACENIANLIRGEMARREAAELASAAASSPPAHARSPRL